jgi:hypothetical protein
MCNDQTCTSADFYTYQNYSPDGTQLASQQYFAPSASINKLRIQQHYNTKQKTMAEEIEKLRLQIQLQEAITAAEREKAAAEKEKAAAEREKTSQLKLKLEITKAQKVQEELKATKSWRELFMEMLIGNPSPFTKVRFAFKCTGSCLLMKTGSKLMKLSICWVVVLLLAYLAVGNTSNWSDLLRFASSSISIGMVYFIFKDFGPL